MVNITLLSDFGLHDASAGIAKGILLSTIPGANIVDISHEVKRHDAAQAAYLLRAVYAGFPPGTIHLVLVDVFYEQFPRLILAAHNEQFFLAPDNGVVPLALNTQPQGAWSCFELKKENSFRDWLKAAASIALQLRDARPQSLGLPPVTLKAPSNNAAPQDNGATCSILYIDNFGNVVTDMDRTRFDQLNRNGRFSLRFMLVNEVTAISTSYTDVRQGEHLCRFNRNGHLEICVNKGNAADLFGFRTGGKHNNIKITFE